MPTTARQDDSYHDRRSNTISSSSSCTEIDASTQLRQHGERTAILDRSTNYGAVAADLGECLLQSTLQVVVCLHILIDFVTEYNDP